MTIIADKEVYVFFFTITYRPVKKHKFKDDVCRVWHHIGGQYVDTGLYYGLDQGLTMFL